MKPALHRFYFPAAVMVTLLLLMQIWLPNLGGVGLQLPYNGLTLFGYAAALLMLALSGLRQPLSSRLTPLVCVLLALAALDGAVYLVQWPMGLAPVFPIERCLLMLSGALMVLGLNHSEYRSLAVSRWVLLGVWAATLVQALLVLVFWCYATWDLGYLTLQLPALFSGVFQQPNVFCSFVATGLAVALLLVSQADQSSRLPLSLAATRIFSVALYISLFIFAMLLTVIQSRVGWLAGLGVCLLTAVQLVRQPPRQRAPYTQALIVIFAGISLGICLMLMAEQTRRGAEFIADTSGNLRLQQWYLVGRLAELHPWLGVGLGHFEGAFADMQAQWFAEGSGFLLPHLRHPHNEVAFWLAETGLFGTVVMLLLLLWLVWRWIQAGLLRHLHYVALLWPIALHCMTEYPLYQSLVHWIVLLLLGWFIEQKLVCKALGLFVWPKAGLIVLMFVAVGAAAYAVHSVRFGYQMTQLAMLDIEQRLQAYSQVVPPSHWRRDFERQFYTDALTIGHQTHNRALVHDYIHWAERHLPEQPELDLYINLVSAYRLVGTESQVAAAQQWMERRFPAEWVAARQPLSTPSQASAALSSVISSAAVADQ